MGRAEQVTPARRARGTATITAVTATAAVLLAGCGTRMAGPPASDRVVTPASAVAAGAQARAGREPPAGSRARAQALAGQLLTRLALPPGARPVRLRVLPPSLRQPQIGGVWTHAADVHRLFLVREPVTAVRGFLRTHLPAGLFLSSEGQGAGAGAITMESLSFGLRAPPPGIDNAELDTAVVPAPGGGSLLRADAEVIWYPARSAAERVDPARYRAAMVTITLFNPRQHTIRRAITSGAVIAQLAGLVDGLHGAPYQPVSCPVIIASYRITFVPAAAPAPQVVVTPSGCMTVGVTVAGAAQPPLWGDSGLVGAARRLLHIKPGPQ